MEAYYYQKMNKPQQAAYHAMQQGVLALADEIQLPRIPAEELKGVTTVEIAERVHKLMADDLGPDWALEEE